MYNDARGMIELTLIQNDLLYDKEFSGWAQSFSPCTAGLNLGKFVYNAVCCFSSRFLIYLSFRHGLI